MSFVRRRCGRETRWRERKRKAGGSRKRKGFPLQGIQNEGPGSDGDAEDGDEDGDGREDIEEEQRREITLATPDANPVTQFKSWIRLITSYFVALHYVKSAVQDHSQHFEGKFIVAKRCSNPVPLKLNWPNVICNLCKKDGARTMSFGDAMSNNPSLQPTSSEDSESHADVTYFTTEQADKPSPSFGN